MDGLQHLRFVAFAFAGADLLVEVDPSGCILFCAGATQRLLGVKAAALEGSAFANLFPLEERPSVAELMARLIAGERLAGLRFSLQRPEERRLAVSISGMTAMKGGGAMQIAIRRRDGGSRSRVDLQPADGPALAAMVAERIAEADLAGDPCALSILQLPNAPTIGLIDQALSRLRAWTLWGDSLLVLNEGRIALVHDGRLSPDRLIRRLTELVGAEPRCLGVMSLDCAASAADLLPALRLEMGRLEAGRPLGAVLLSQALRNAARAAVAPVTALRAAFSRSDITLLFQPVVSLRKWTVHHYEALSRVSSGDQLQLPGPLLHHASHQGLAAEFDLAVCRAAVRCCDDGQSLPDQAHVSVNISAAALATPGFADALLGVLGSNPRILDRILIEVGGLDRSTDLAETAHVLHQIRGMGCRITLDDLLSGGPDLMAIQRIHPNYIKIDTLSLRETMRGRTGVALLRALAQLCDDLGIGSIAKRVEEESLVRLLCDVSIDLGQGYYFARPARSFAQDFAPPRPAAPLPRPTVTRTQASTQAQVLPPMGFGRHALAKPGGMAHRHRP